MRRLALRIHGARPGAAAAALLALPLVLVLLGSQPVEAQHPNHSQGFRPEHVFEVGGIENIDLFNLNLTLVIQLGPSYPVGPELSSLFTLTYAGNPWEWDLESVEGSPDEEYLQAIPRQTGNAGLGWELGFGRFPTPQDPQNSSPGPQYQSPDQALHTLTGALHDAGIDHLPNQPVAYTTDGTYLRLQNASQTLEHPDGTRRSFGSQARPTRIEDAFGNGVSIDYLDTDAKGDARRWVVRDDHGREHTVLLGRRQGRLVVTQVQLETFGGGTGTYTLSYTDVLLPRACNQPVHCNEPDGFCGDSSHVWVPLLT
jgi:hypothetical protein